MRRAVINKTVGATRRLMPLERCWTTCSSQGSYRLHVHPCNAADYGVQPVVLGLHSLESICWFRYSSFRLHIRDEQPCRVDEVSLSTSLSLPKIPVGALPSTRRCILITASPPKLRHLITTLSHLNSLTFLLYHTGMMATVT